MARGTKAKTVKSKPKTAVAATRAKSAAPTTKKAALKLVKGQAVAPKAKAATTQKEAVSTTKNVSQRLLETIERRKKERAGGAPFAKAPGRRGRRPKHPVDYVPQHGEEGGGENADPYQVETEYEGLEYDTGIRFKEGGEDKSFSMERFEEFDEELNFDW